MSIKILYYVLDDIITHWLPVLQIYHQCGLTLPLLKHLPVTECCHSIISSFLFQLASTGMYRVFSFQLLFWHSKIFYVELHGFNTHIFKDRFGYIMVYSVCLSVHWQHSLKYLENTWKGIFVSYIYWRNNAFFIFVNFWLWSKVLRWSLRAVEQSIFSYLLYE